ncbi:MAG: hypothetical protein ACI8XO_002210 [Verrucomicrobiales bacterium]|jgi:hypothetical protein
MKKMKCLNQLALTGFLVMMVAFFPACKTLERSERVPEGEPGVRTGYLTAKVVAYRHAMENQPKEDKRYGEGFYTAAGIVDEDPAHVKVLVAALDDMFPSVIEGSKIYTRDENSKWFEGKPAVVWNSRLMKKTDDLHVFIVLGWMHSNLLFQYYEYETRYLKKTDAWEVVGFELIDRVVD